jgi:TonB family protein
MNMLLALRLTVALLAPAPSDTPPAPPSREALTQMRSLADIVAQSRLVDGTAAPAQLKLPRALNQRQVVGFILDNYPAALRELGSLESAYAWLLVDARGRVGNAAIAKSTGRDALDSLALRAVSITRFDPATLGSERIGVWMPYPITILPYKRFQELEASAATETPIATRYTVKPMLLNRDEVRLEIAARYPADMSKARIRGEVRMWLLLDEEGNVQDARVKKSSGYPQMDAASLEVVRVMRFRPAEDNGTHVSVWIEIPIVFNLPQARGRG